MTPSERFWSKVQVGPECWEWLAGRDKDGYGKFRVSRTPSRHMQAHRMAYELAFGPVPKGLVVRQTCRNHSCVNPSHLEAVTHRVKTLDSDAVSAHYAAQTHCKRGHELSGDNLLPDTTGRRVCRECRRLASSDYSKARTARGETAAYQREYRRCHGDRTRARQAVRRAVASGVLSRPDVCESCNKEVKVQAHHDDYSRPLEVRWLCTPCHGALHAATAPPPPDVVLAEPAEALV